jgi:hypothetical protein
MGQNWVTTACIWNLGSTSGGGGVLFYADMIVPVKIGNNNPHIPRVLLKHS